MKNVVEKLIPQSPKEVAYEYAKQGAPVFPCDPNSKKPYLRAKKDSLGQKIPKSGGLYQATTNLQTIDDWWDKYPDAMIGIPTGSASGYVAIDIDNDPGKGIEGLFEWKKLEDKYGPITLTGTVVTPRGGKHYYFKIPKGVVIKNSASSLAPGIDIRGEGGYIIAGGSIRADGKRYVCEQPLNTSVEIPDWLVTRIYKISGDKSKELSSSNFEKRPVNSNINLDGEIAKVASTQIGGRNDALNRTAFLLGKAGFDEVDVTSRLVEASRINGLINEDGEYSIRDTISRAFAEGQSSTDQSARQNYEDAEYHLERLNKEYFVTPYGPNVFVCRFEKNDTGRVVPVYRTFQAFEHLYSNILVWRNGRPVKLGKFWLEHPKRRQYAGVSFVPNGLDVLPGNIKNLWLGFDVTPNKGICTLIIKHIHDVLANGNKIHFDYIMNFLAWMVQNPDKQAEVILILKGSEGTGKGLVGRLMMDFFGSASFHISSSRHLVGNFNAHLDGTVVLFADEAFWAGDKASRGALFALVTEPYITIERKGIDAKQVANRLHIIMASNEDWVVPAEYDSRRFAVFEVSDQYKQKSSYFTPLYKEIENGGREAFLHELLHRDIVDFHPRQIVKTSAFRDQVTNSLGPIQTWWIGLLEEGFLPVEQGSAPKGVVLSNDLHGYGSMHEWMRKSDQRFARIPNRKITNFLREQGCEPWRSATQRGWRMPPLKQARLAWEKIYGPWPWPNDLEDWDTFPASPF